MQKWSLLVIAFRSNAEAMIRRNFILFLNNFFFRISSEYSSIQNLQFVLKNLNIHHHLGEVVFSLLFASVVRDLTKIGLDQEIEKGLVASALLVTR